MILCLQNVVSLCYIYEPNANIPLLWPLTPPMFLILYLHCYLRVHSPSICSGLALPLFLHVFFFFIYVYHTELKLYFFRYFAWYNFPCCCSIFLYLKNISLYVQFTNIGYYKQCFDVRFLFAWN